MATLLGTLRNWVDHLLLLSRLLKFLLLCHQFRVELLLSGHRQRLSHQSSSCKLCLYLRSCHLFLNLHVWVHLLAYGCFCSLSLPILNSNFSAAQESVGRAFLHPFLQIGLIFKPWKQLDACPTSFVQTIYCKR